MTEPKPNPNNTNVSDMFEESDPFMSRNKSLSNQFIDDVVSNNQKNIQENNQETNDESNQENNQETNDESNKLKREGKGGVKVRKKFVSSKEYYEDIEEEAPAELDLLDLDRPIRGQKFCCMSFAEPKFQSLEKKETFFMTEFLKKFLVDYTKNVITKIADDKGLDAQELIEEYDLEKKVDDDKDNFTDDKWKETKEINNKNDPLNNFFKPELVEMLVKYNKYRNNNHKDNMKLLKKRFPNETFRSAVKFRGAFPTRQKAQKYADALFKKDKVVNIFVMQAGAWVPFNPGEDEIKNSKTTEKKLNNLLWQYRKNQVYAEHFFNERKEELIKEKARKNINKRQVRTGNQPVSKPNKIKTDDENNENDEITENNVNMASVINDDVIGLDDTEVDDLIDRLKNK